MPLNALHHCAIRTVKLKETRDFYVDILGMEDGDRPAFNFPGHWLYVEGEPVVHLMGVADGLDEYLGDREASTLEGTGAIDHIAFNITEPDELCQRMKQQEIPYKERKVPGMDLFQYFVTDPNGITIELNYWTT